MNMETWSKFEVNVLRKSAKQLAELSIRNGFKVTASEFVSDYISIKRSWRERLFSRPWNPFLKIKTIYAPQAHVIGEICLVSPRTYTELTSLTPEEEVIS